MPYELPPLPYPYEALEPHIDAKTMQVHHDLHHKAYVDGLNKALDGLAKAREANDFAAIQQLSRLVAFHGGGHTNHTIFWHNLAPAGKGGGGEPGGELATQIRKDFGDFAKFKAQFSAAAAAVEGNGWSVLAWHPVLHALTVQTMMNQQNLHVMGSVPILMLDVWEHAYYLKYQNRRAEYVTAFWNVAHWKDCEARFAKASKIAP